jgi:DNA-binding transcriptional LysR family regulator
LVATFVEAARRLSFSDTAKALGLTPGSVSQNIKNLEEQLGVRLFARTTRHVRLTPEGTRYLSRCAPRWRRWPRPRAPCARSGTDSPGGCG